MHDPRALLDMGDALFAASRGAATSWTLMA